MILNLKSNHELLKIARDIALSKDLDYESVIEIVSDAIRDSLRSFYGKDNIHVKLNSTSGEVKVTREFIAVDDINTKTKSFDIEEKESINFMTLKEAQTHKENAKEGDIIKIPMSTSGSLGQDVIVRVRSGIIKRLCEAERIQLYKKYSKRVGEIINGIVKRIGYGTIIVETNGMELPLPIKELMPKESFRQGEQICASIELSEDSKYGEIFLSRSSKNFVAGLFAKEIPEICDGIITIKAIARIPGFKTKVAVSSSDPNIEPVGACIGRSGSRIKQINKELQREKIDVLEFSSDISLMAKRTMMPAKVTSFEYNKENNSAKIVIADEDLSIAIGKNGNNTKLASQILKCRITVVGEDVDSKSKMELFNASSSTLAKALDVEDIIAQILFAEGFCSIELIANAGIEKLSQIQGFNDEISKEIIGRAESYMQNIENKYLSKIENNWLKEKFLQFAQPILPSIVEQNIFTLEDFADLSLDDLEQMIEDQKISENEIDLDKIGNLIMEAREMLRSTDRN